MLLTVLQNKKYVLVDSAIFLVLADFDPIKGGSERIATKH